MFELVDFRALEAERFIGLNLAVMGERRRGAGLAMVVFCSIESDVVAHQIFTASVSVSVRFVKVSLQEVRFG